MIKNERLIRSMSPAQKIKLITSAERHRNRVVDGYAFPQFCMAEQPSANKGVRATAFPSDRALACAFNPALAEKVYRCMGNEAKANVPAAYFNVSNRKTALDASPDPYLTGRLLSAKVKGIKESGAFVNFDDETSPEDDAEEKTVKKLLTDAVLGENDPDTFVTLQPADSSYAEYRLESMRCGVATCKEDVARYLYEGYSFVFLESDFTDELIPYFAQLTEEYDRAYEACKRGKITPQKLDMCCRELTMLSAERIDEACDHVVEALIRLSNNNADSVAERRLSLPGGTQPLFDEPQHHTVALSAARQSVVMLKNDGILPLKHEWKVAVLGEYAKNPAYHEDGNTPTYGGLPFDVINDYEIKTAGFAYGYRRGDPNRPDLLKTARSLCAEADAAIVYLCAEPGAVTLPPEQTELLDFLAKQNVRIIAVVAADGILDMSFDNKCNAVLYTQRGGQAVAAAVFEIITGAISPCGKLAWPMPVRVDSDAAAYGNAVRFPMGFGLSYTLFAYSKLQLSDRGASFTVTNTGEFDGFVTPQLYVQKLNKEPNAPPADIKLRGYNRVFVKKHDSVKVEIRFGPETFRSYNEEKERFWVAGGKYAVYVGESAHNLKLQGEMTLAEHVFRDEKISSEREEASDGEKALAEFADTQDKRAFYERNRGTAFGLKLVLSLLLAVYFDASIGLLWANGFVPDLWISYLCVGVLLGVVNLGVLIFIIVSARKYTKRRATAPVPLLGDAVANLGEFKELANVSYEHPLTADEAEGEEPEEPETEAQEEPAPAVYTYETYTERTERNVTFRENVSLGELCTNFHDYVRGWGIEVEPASVRAFFAALASSRLILVDVKNTEALPTLLMALGAYFGDADGVEAQPEWNKPNDLLWRIEGGKYVPSGFLRAVQAAADTPDKNAVAIVSNVRTDTFKSYFDDFIRYAMYPSEEHVIKLNDSDTLTLPHNLHCVLFTQDGWAGMPSVAAAASVQIEMVISRTSAATEAVEIKTVSRRSFEELVKEAREEFYLPETIWKKLDELVDAVSANEYFRIGNKNTLQLERLTSILLACGADEGEAFSMAFTAKIVSRLKTLQLYKQEGGEKTVYGMIEKLFGEENLSKIQKALAKTARVA